VTGTRALGALALTAALALAGAAHAAPGDTKYKGVTDEGSKVTLVVGNAGNPTKFKLGEIKVPCENGTVTNQPGAYSDFDRSDPGEFEDTSKSKSRGEGVRFKSKSRLAGEASPSGRSWKGTLNLKSKVFKNGERIDTCKLSTNWQAS
jgi:hypothetical protein